MAWYNFPSFPLVPPQPFVWPFPAPAQEWPNSSGCPVPETNVKTSTGDIIDNKDSE